jgi:hypothetical protein
MNCAIGNANDHITIAAKQVAFDTTIPGLGGISRSALLDMVLDLGWQKDRDCHAAAQTRIGR